MLANSDFVHKSSLLPCTLLTKLAHIFIKWQNKCFHSEVESEAFCINQRALKKAQGITVKCVYTRLFNKRVIVNTTPAMSFEIPSLAS